jgi:uncharacterized delta-60 repeat protein
MGQINIKSLDESRIPNPGDGRTLFSDDSNLDHLSVRKSDGTIVDLEAGKDILLSNEINFTITSEELTNMNHDDFSDPLNGYEILPAPGEGKAYVVGMDGIFAAYKSNHIPFEYDPEFNVSPNDEIFDIRIQKDNKILIGGAFSSPNDHLARLNPDGTVDPSFNMNGGFAFGSVIDIKIQPDNKIIVGGSFTEFDGITYNRIVRMHYYGTVDTSFNTGTGFNSTVYVTETQDDGKIIVGGSFTNYNGTSVYNSICRLNTDGSIDNTFDLGISSPGTLTITDLKIIKSGTHAGKIMIVGSFNTYNGVSVPSSLIRLNSDGTWDDTFNNGGAGFSPGDASFVELLDDGRMVVTGNFAGYNGDNMRQSIIILNENGSVDTSFTSFFTGQLIRQTVIQPNGKIILSGSFGSNYGQVGVPDGILRLNTDGTLDTTFNVGTGVNDYTNAIALSNNYDETSDTSAVFLGGSFLSFNGTLKDNIVKLRPDGSIASTVIIDEQKEGYMAVPYGTRRSLDFYYPQHGQNGNWSTNIITSIPLMSGPYMTHDDLCLPSSKTQFTPSALSSRFTSISTNPTPFGVRDSLYFYNYQETLRIDGIMDTVIYQQTNIEAQNYTSHGFTYSKSNFSTVNNQPLYVGTNGEIAKQLENTDGYLKIRMWYSVIDVSDMVVEKPPIKNPLPEFNLPGVPLKYDTSYQFVGGLNFNDNELMIPTFMELDNAYSDITQEKWNDYYTQFKQNRDSHHKNTIEITRNEWYNRDGYTDGNGFKYQDKYDIPLNPIKNAPIGFSNYTFNVPKTNMNFNNVALGYPYDFSTYLKATDIDKLPYDVDHHSMIWSAASSVGPNGPAEEYVFDSNSGRVSGLTIVNAGSGYSVGDDLIFSGGGGVDAAGEVEEVGTSGEILKVRLVSITPKVGTPAIGGRGYTSPPSITITGGSSAVVTATIENGQWLLISQFDTGEAYTLEDILTRARSTSDAFEKVLNELILAQEPFLLSNLTLPGFQIKKYKS